MSKTAVTTYYLEMTSRASLKRKTEVRGMNISECRIKQPQFNKFLYQFIGGPWLWIDKLSWSEEQWAAYVESDNLRTWVGYVEGAIAGYYELSRQEDGNVEISYFGLAPDFIGKGYGGYLLSEAIHSAWQWQGTQRVWVHTCTLDHPSALQNYQSRGMKIYKRETEEQDI